MCLLKKVKKVIVEWGISLTGSCETFNLLVPRTFYNIRFATVIEYFHGDIFMVHLSSLRKGL